METIESFISKVNTSSGLEPLELKNNLEKSFEKELSFNDVYAKLLASKQESIKVKEIVLESEIDFINSAKQLKAIFELQLTAAIEKVNDLYNRELLNLQSFYRNKFAGEGLMDLIKAFSNSEYSLVIMNSRIYAYKYYEPFHPVTEGQYESGMVYLYDEPVCSLKGVYVNLLHPRITNGSILISTDYRHPNSSNKGLTEVCVGNLEGRAIPIENTEALLELLNEICTTYEVMHLDSAYFQPEGSYTTKEGALKWTA